MESPALSNLRNTQTGIIENFPSLAYINIMWTLHLSLQFCQIKGKPSLFSHFLLKTFGWYEKKTIPLHPLLRTNAVTKQLLSQKGQTKERVLWKDYNKQRSSSTRSRLLFHPYYIGVMDKEVLGRTKPINFWRWYRMIFGGILNRDKTNFPSGKVIIKKLYNSWSSERSKSLLLFPSRDKNV